MAKPLKLHRLERVLPHSGFDLFCSILLIGVILQPAFLNYKLIYNQFFVSCPNTISRVSSPWRQRQRRNKSLQQVFDAAVKFALIGCGTGLMILGHTSLQEGPGPLPLGGGATATAQQHEAVFK